MFKELFFFKIRFINIKSSNLKSLIKKRGLFLFPSGPGLANLKINSPYHKALVKANHVFFDSGYFVILLRVLKKIKADKFSGYKFLKFFFKYLKQNRRKNIFVVDPSINSMKLNKSYFNNKINIKSTHFVSPIYKRKNIKDKKLLKQIRLLRPEIILINLGSGVQEILGDYLMSNLKYNPSIICTGAAISFFTKEQAPINDFFDKIYLGWLIRIFYNPKIFFLRYLNAIKLYRLVKNNKVFVKN